MPTHSAWYNHSFDHPWKSQVIKTQHAALCLLQANQQSRPNERKQWRNSHSIFSLSPYFFLYTKSFSLTKCKSMQFRQLLTSKTDGQTEWNTALTVWASWSPWQQGHWVGARLHHWSSTQTAVLPSMHGLPPDGGRRPARPAHCGLHAHKQQKKS